MNTLNLPLRAEPMKRGHFYKLCDADGRCLVEHLTKETAEALAAMSEELRTLRNTYEIDRYENLRTENFLRGLGYRPCDIAACNCGSWHIDKAALAAGGEK